MSNQTRDHDENPIGDIPVETRVEAFQIGWNRLKQLNISPRAFDLMSRAMQENLGLTPQR